MALSEEMERQGAFLFRYRGTLPLIILTAGVIVFILQGEKLINNSLSLEFDYYVLICLIISLFGLLIRVLTVGFTLENTSGRNIEVQVADVLNTTGLYSIVRHPLYFGNFFIWLGVAMIIENIWVVVIFILIFWLYYERIMYAEEQYLRNKFGDEYRSWSEITPAFIPNLGLWQGTNIKFSIKKVLKKEKNGLAAIFIVFYIFNIINNIINQQNIFFHNLWLFVLCLFGIFNYLIFTYLKRRTHVLDEEGR